MTQEYFDEDSSVAGVDTFLMPSECLALCWGFTQEQIIGQCEFSIDTNWNDCDCPEPTDSDWVCVTQEYFDEDSSVAGVDTFLMPSECIALCWGFTQEQIIGQCEFSIDTSWNDCDCPEPADSDWVCVIQEYFCNDSLVTGVDTFMMPSECLALCWGFTQEQIIGQCEFSVDTFWNDCDCPEPADSDWVCVTQEYFDEDSSVAGVDTFMMPSECLALCWGFTQEQIIGQCEFSVDTFWNDCDCPEPADSDWVCVVGDYYDFDSVLVQQDTFWMPSECIALCYGFTEDQILGNCGVDSSYTYESLTATRETVKTQDLDNIYLYPNPVDSYFMIDLSGVKAEKVNITITGMDGRIVYEKHLTGKSQLRIDANRFIAGLYFVKIQTNESNKILKLIKAN